MLRMTSAAAVAAEAEAAAAAQAAVTAALCHTEGLTRGQGLQTAAAEIAAELRVKPQHGAWPAAKVARGQIQKKEPSHLAAGTGQHLPDCRPKL